MRCAVVLDREPSVGIVEVRAGHEETGIIAKGNLAPRMRQSGQNQEESQSRLHHALGGWIGQSECALQAPYPPVTGVGAGPTTQPAAVDQTTMQRRIQQRDGVGQMKPASEVCNGPNRGRHLKATPDRRLGRGNAAAADDHPSEPRSAVCTGHRGLDGATGSDIETVKPGSGGSGKNRRVRQTELCCDQPRHWRLGDLMPGIDATTKSPPACPEQLRSRQAKPQRLFDSERAFGQFRRNARSRRHATNAGRCAACEQRRLLTPSVGCARYQGIAIANAAHTRRC